jgi:hypothetical protein
MSDLQQQPEPPKTATEARTVLDARMADKDWGGRIFNGDAGANKELRELTAMVAAGGADTVAVAVAGNPVRMPTTEQAHMAHTAALFRDLGIRDEVTSQFLRGEQVTPLEYELVANWKKTAMGDNSAGGFVERYLAGNVEAKQKMLIADSVLTNGIREEKAA